MQLQEASAEFLNGYFSTHERRERTKVAYKFDLALFLSFAGGDLDLSSLSGTVIEHWAAHLRQEGYAPASIRRKMVALRVFCSYWVRKGPLSESPFWRVKLSFGRIEQLPRALTRFEAQTLLAQARLQQSKGGETQKKRLTSDRAQCFVQLLSSPKEFSAHRSALRHRHACWRTISSRYQGLLRG